MTTNVRASSRAVLELAPSGIRQVMDVALTMPEAIHLEIGDPDTATPAHIVQAGFDAAREGKTGYTATAGLPQLRGLLTEKLRRVNDIDVPAGRVLVTAGAVGAIQTTYGAILRAGDNVLGPDPAWPNFAMLAQLRGAQYRPYALDPGNGFLPDLAELERLVDDRTTTLIVNSPSNPLGSVTPAGQLTELAEFAARHDLWIISDECYDQLTFAPGYAATLAAAPEHADRIVSVYSFSKTYAMTGWRIGYAVLPPRLFDPVCRVQEATTSCVSSVSQHAAIAALSGPQDCVETMRATYQHRRDAVLARLDEAGIPALRPDGAFYVWLDLTAAGPDSADTVVQLLRSRGVALAPGTAFGSAGSGWARLSLANSMEALTRGVDEIAGYLAEVAPSGSRG